MTAKKNDRMTKSDKAGSQSVTMKAPNRGFLRVKIVGTSPLICHRKDNPAERERLRAEIAGKKMGKTKRDPEQEYIWSMYYLDDESYGYPAGSFAEAMRTVALDQKKGGNKAVNGAFVERAIIALTDPLGQNKLIKLYGEPHMREDFVNIGTTISTPSLRYRGCFDDWHVVLEIQYNADYLTPDDIINLLLHAGTWIGVGNWRPEKGGTFGKFTVESTEQVEYKDVRSLN